MARRCEVAGAVFLPLNHGIESTPDCDDALIAEPEESGRQVGPGLLGGPNWVHEAPIGATALRIA